MSTIYEAHVTVEHYPTQAQTDKFSDQVLNKFPNNGHIGGKPLLIELSQGKYPLQLMLAIKRPSDYDIEALRWGEVLGVVVNYEGWNVVRVKVESPLMAGQSEYFEAHWKLYAQHSNEIQVFAEANPGWLLSHNALDKRIHYLSQRNYSQSHEEAQNQFMEANLKLRASGLNVIKCHYERVLWDTFKGLDEGWAVETPNQVCSV